MIKPSGKLLSGLPAAPRISLHFGTLKADPGIFVVVENDGRQIGVYIKPRCLEVLQNAR